MVESLATRGVGKKGEDVSKRNEDSNARTYKRNTTATITSNVKMPVIRLASDWTMTSIHTETHQTRHLPDLCRGQHKTGRRHSTEWCSARAH